jgi:glutathione S-transferase
MKSIHFTHLRHLAIDQRVKLYYSPAAISLVTHIALEEAGLPYDLEKISIREGQHLTPSYRRIHPLARLPALEIGPGDILTETPALLRYIADLVPDAKLLPTEGRAAACANEWLSLCASGVHPQFIGFFAPTRYTDDPAAAEAVSRDCKRRFFDLLQHVESRLPEHGFALGDAYSLCDAYLVVFFLWARKFELPVATLARYARLSETVLTRPAVRRALAQEGLGKLVPAIAGDPPRK